MKPRINSKYYSDISWTIAHFDEYRTAEMLDKYLSMKPSGSDIAWLITKISSIMSQELIQIFIDSDHDVYDDIYILSRVPHGRIYIDFLNFKPDYRAWYKLIVESSSFQSKNDIINYLNCRPPLGNMRRLFEHIYKKYDKLSLLKILKTAGMTEDYLAKRIIGGRGLYRGKQVIKFYLSYPEASKHKLLSMACPVAKKRIEKDIGNTSFFDMIFDWL